jgi:hypothetical protein
MGLTLGLLACVLVLLPGVAVLAAFNVRTRRGGARRPELALTTTSALLIAVLFSIIVHSAAFILAHVTLGFVTAVHTLVPALDFGPPVTNPIAAFLDAVAGKPIALPSALALAGTLLLECMAVGSFMLSDAFALLSERQDFNGQGWVFEHVTRPAENGYTPVGHVYTSTMSGNYGIAYKGPIIDLRQGDKGEILAVALARPERFLYELGASNAPVPTKRGWGTRRKEPPSEAASRVRHHEKDYTGGVVALDARVINNIVVHSVANSLLEAIDANVPDSADEDVL